MDRKHVRWQELDRRFMELQGDIDLDNYLSPTNRTMELRAFKAAVSDGRVYNPLFTYASLPDVHEDELMAFRDELDLTDPVESIFHEAVTCRLGEIDGAKTHRGSVITRGSLAMYGRPSAALQAVARQNLTTFQPDQAAYNGTRPGRIYNAEELAVICREAMKGYGFDWKVIVKDDFGAKAAVDNLVKEFWIRSDVLFHESLVTMLVVHEIGCHVLRSENGYAQPLKIFGRGLPAYQFTEEGLAEYSEEMAGALSDDTVYRISGRVLGVEAALNGSFWDVYLTVRDYFDVDMAFDIAQRAKLGIADTSEPGSYTKDYTYLAGLHRIREFFSAPTRPEIQALYAGKVGFHHLDAVKELQAIGYLTPPKALPDWVQSRM
ncbi:DUF1704 domain-containing protein [bacterium]|nr:DUF1704 domain-containing protein [candidate division CSSED10-310 bacterium]